MKALGFLTALLISANTFAADIGTCLMEVKQNCIGGITVGIAANTDCKIVEPGVRPEDFQPYAKKIILFDDNTITSFMIGKSNTCSVSTAEVRGRIVDDVAISGRLFLTTRNGLFLAVGRDNRIVEVLSADGDRYQQLVSLKALPSGGVILQKKGADVRLNSAQLTERVNNKRTIRCLANCPE